jgi:hypothetical protein
MRFVYLSLDAVNQALAARLAVAAGGRFSTLAFSDPLPTDPQVAVLYDLDFLPAEYREHLLDDLAAGRRAGRVGVHGYSLSPFMAQELLRRGVVVTRRLRGGLFRQLRDLAKALPVQVTVISDSRNGSEEVERIGALVRVKRRAGPLPR